MSLFEPLKKSDLNIYDVWVVQVGENMDDQLEKKLFIKRQKIVKQLRESGIKAGTELKQSTGLGNQMKLTLKSGTPFIIFVGEKELASDKVSVKNMVARIQRDMLDFSHVLMMINEFKKKII